MVEVTDKNVLDKLAEKKRANEQAQNVAMPIRNMIDDHGKVKVWLVTEKKWVKVWPIDAMEIMKSGGANLTGPEMEKPEVVAVDFSKYTAAELKAFGQLAEIGGAESMTKAKLIEALTVVNFVPTTE